MTMAHTNISIKQQEMGGLHQKEKDEEPAQKMLVFRLLKWSFDLQK